MAVFFNSSGLEMAIALVSAYVLLVILVTAANEWIMAGVTSGSKMLSAEAA